jgi:hypothetical protein
VTVCRTNTQSPTQMSAQMIFFGARPAGHQRPRRPGDDPVFDLARWGTCGLPSIWRSPTARRPGGSPRRNRRVRCLALPPGCRVVALRGGRWEATPCPPGLRRASSGWPRPSRRSAGPARARSLRSTRSSGRPSRPPDHGPESTADQRTSFVVGQRCISLLSVVSSAETAHRRPRSRILNAESVHAPSGGDPWLSWLGELGV